MSSTLKKLAIGGGIAIATRKLAELGTQAVGLAIDAEEAESAFRTAFGTALPQIGSFVDDFAGKAGFARHELEQMLAVTGSVIQGIGGTEEESAALSEQMATLAGDVASFSNATGGSTAVLQALQSAINGEREALKTYGLAIVETEVQQRALLDTGKEHADELTRLEKAQATVNLAYEKAGKAVGDLDRTQDSAANTLRRIQGRLKEAGAEIGAAFIPLLEKLLPTIDAAIPIITDQLVPAFEGMVTAIANFDITNAARDLEVFFATLGAVEEAGPIGAFLDPAVKSLRDFGASLRAGVEPATALEAVLVRLASEGVTTSELEAITTQLADLSGLDAAGLTAVAENIERFGTAAGFGQFEVDAMVDSVRNLAFAQSDLPTAEESRALFEGGIEGPARAAAGAVSDLGGEMPEAAQGILDMIPAAEEAAEAFREDLAAEAEDFITGFEKLPDRIKITMGEFEKNLTDRVAAQAEFWEGLATLAESGFGRLAEEIREQGPEAAGLLEGLVSDMDRAAELEGLLEDAETQMGDLADRYATGLEQNADPTLTALGQFGVDMLDAIAEGIESGDISRALAAKIRKDVAAATGQNIPGGGLPPSRPSGGAGPFQTGTWEVPGTGPVPAIVHGGETIFGAPGTSGRAAMVRELANELARVTTSTTDGRASVTIEQINVTVPAGTTASEAIVGAGAEAAIEALIN